MLNNSLCKKNFHKLIIVYILTDDITIWINIGYNVINNHVHMEGIFWTKIVFLELSVGLYTAPTISRTWYFVDFIIAYLATLTTVSRRQIDHC